MVSGPPRTHREKFGKCPVSVEKGHLRVKTGDIWAMSGTSAAKNGDGQKLKKHKNVNKNS